MSRSSHRRLGTVFGGQVKHIRPPPQHPITIPVQTLRRIVAILLEHGKITRGYIGVGVQPARLPDVVAQQIEQETGVLLSSVDGGAPAETAGLLLGDTIVSLDDQPVRHLDDLITHLSGDHIGHEVNVRFVRGGELQETKVVVGVRGED